jgi:arylsulfatase A-like enzyme
VALPSDARLRFATAVEPLLGAASLRTAPHTFRLRLDGALVFEEELAVEVLGEAIRWHALDLPRGGARAARLEFEVEGPLALTSILAPSIGPREFGRPDARPFEGARRPDLVVFLADTFRADNLAAYGGKPGLTPEIDRFASEARTFTRAWSTGTHTLAAHSSMFSGVYPHQNGQVDFFNPLPHGVESLAELLGAHGYRCAAVTDGVMVSQIHGLAQGFEVFDERRETGTLERVEGVLAADDGRPLFLFVQTYGAHTPYSASAATRERLAGELALERSFDELMASEVMRAYFALPLGAEMPGDRPGVGEVARGLSDLYRAGAAEVDALFGRFRAGLAAGGLTSGYLLFASDHGEAFFEHGRAFHANRVFEEELRIPLVLAGPGIAAGREERPVSLIDFAPTLAALAGLEAPAHWRGSSLLAPPDERPLFAFQSHRVHELSTLAVIDGRRKLIGYETLEAVRAGRLHGAFDLESDPAERESLVEREGWPAELMRARAAELEVLLTPLFTQEVLSPSGAELEEMQQLGYGGAEPERPKQ